MNSADSTPPADPAPGTVIVDESFDGLTALPDGWTAQTDGWSVSGGVLNQTSTEDVRVITFGPHVNNFRLEADVTFTGIDNNGAWGALGIDVTGTAPFWQMGINCSDPNPPYLDIAFHGADGSWNAGNGTGVITAPFTMPDGTTVHAEVDVWGDHVEGYLGGDHLITWDGISRTTAGTFGLLMGAGATGTFDNVRVTVLSGFADVTYTTASIPPGGRVQQPLAGLWNGPTPPAGFTRLSGSSWLSVSPAGLVSGTAPSPAPDQTGTITVQATDGSSTSYITVQVPVAGAAGQFVAGTYTIPAVPAGTAVRQKVAGLWDGATPSAYTKVSGDAWLSVSPDGVVSGTAPARAPAQPGLITVTNGSDAALTVEVPVLASGSRAQITAASWNLRDNGSHVSGPLAKELAVIAASGLDVIGIQESGGTGAAALAGALGWHCYQSSGDLGIVSAYPVSAITPPAEATPAAGVTLDVHGQPVRVWVAHLDEADYGPGRAAAGDTDLVAHEKTTVRYAQALAVAREMAPDLARAAAVPVILLGDLASPSGADGSTDWPVPDVFARAGLTDSLRAVYPRPASNPAYTYDLLAAGGAADRVDYVDFAGPLRPVAAERLYTGWPQSGSADSQWVSDHAAAVTLFQLSQK